MSRKVLRFDEELVKQIKELKERLQRELGIKISDAEASRIYARLNREFVKNIKVINNLDENSKKKKKKEKILFGIKLDI